MSDQLVIFELEVVALDSGPLRRRWNGAPMHSAEASAALFTAVDAFQQAVRDAGFDIATTSYGAKAESA